MKIPGTLAQRIILMAAFCGLPAFTATAAMDCARPNVAATFAPATVTVATVVPDQFIDAQQIKIDTVVGATPQQPSAPSAHRTVTAWQVNTGRWNGQLLDGLSLVLVQDVSNDPTVAGDIAIYISDFSTTAQRDALLAALSAAHPTLFMSRDAACHLEPAFIRIELVNGNTVVLHLGTIAALDSKALHVA